MRNTLLLLALVAVSLAGAVCYTCATVGPAALPWLGLAPVMALAPAVGVKSLDWFPYRIRGGVSSAQN